MPENIYLLKIFEGIEKNTVDFIINNCEIRSYNKWAILMSEWDNSNQEGYILKSWKVSINIHEQDIKKLDEWDIFWEIALLNEETRTATVTAIKNIQVIVLKLEHLIEMINSDDNRINKKIISRIEENLERAII